MFIPNEPPSTQCSPQCGGGRLNNDGEERAEKIGSQKRGGEKGLISEAGAAKKEGLRH